MHRSRVAMPGTLSGALFAYDSKCYNTGVRLHYTCHSNDRRSDLALYAIRKEMIRLCDIRNEMQNILGYGKVAELQYAENLLLSANDSAEVGDAMRKFLRPSITVVEQTDFASIRRLMTFTLLHVKGEANVLA